MDELRQMLTDHLRGRGLPGDHVTSYLKSLEKLIESEPGIEQQAGRMSLGGRDESLQYCGKCRETSGSLRNWE